MRLSNNWSDRRFGVLNNLSVETKAYLYIFLIGLIGAVVGVANSEIQAQKINTMITNPNAKIQQISLAAFAGIGAATLISLPIFLKEN